MKYLAIDIGGTAIKAGIVTSEGDVCEKMSTPTPMTDFEDLVSALSGIVIWAKSKAEIAGIALSQPCVTDADTAQALSEGALIYIKDTNPAQRLGELYQLPYSAENDGNCAALAEVWKGSAKAASSMALVVCGTGVGGAVVIDKKIISGKRKFAGEFGMFIMGEGENGEPLIWSAVGSTLALVNAYKEKSSDDSEGLSGKAIFDKAEAGDRLAIHCIDQFYKTFAHGLHNIQHVYDPELILIGGAISERPEFIPRIETEFDRLYSLMGGLMSRPSIGVCTGGADANLIGAVYHLLTQTNSGFKG